MSTHDRNPVGDAGALIEHLRAWATQRADVHVAMVVGSQARHDHPADPLSDIDVVLTVDDPERFLRDDEWLTAFGPVAVDVVEATPIGGMLERRVLFASGQDVDFSFVPIDMTSVLGDFKDLAEVRELLGRGVLLLVDEVGIAAELATIEPPEPTAALLSEDEYGALSAAFWYQLLVATKKWRRGELWVALASVEGPLTERTMQLLRWWTKLRDPATDVWHEARFVEEWLDPSVMSELAATRGGYGRDEVRTGLVRLAALFERTEHECCELSGYAPRVDRDDVARRFDALSAPPMP